RYTNTSDMASYLANPIHNRAEEQILTVEDEMEEYMFLGLRMMKGVDKTEFTRLFGKDYDEVYGDITRRHIEQGLMAAEGSRLYLTDIGIDISNTVMADYIL
ncbi:MAG: coproporphyrinogen III oxidase, partial [Lachnospiraceae bacterium]